MSRSRVKYTRLKQTTEFHQDKDGFCDEQFEDDAPPRAPVKAIVLAVFLFVVGSVMIVLGSLMLAGVIGVDFGDRAVPLLVIGTVCFLPGFYNLGIVYLAWRGYHGYSYADIPTYND